MLRTAALSVCLMQVWKRYPVPTRFPERLELEVTSKRVSANQDEAVVERRVTYNYSERVPIFLQAQIQGANRFEMRETLTFNWVARMLTVDVHNESSKDAIKYSERVTFTPDPENDARTVIRQTGFSECSSPFAPFMGQFFDDMCREIYNYNYQKNMDADASFLQERAASNEVVGYFPTYLRAAFLEDTDPALLPPLPPRQQPSKSAAAQSMSVDLSRAVENEPKLDEEEAARKLAWIFSPTPPLNRGGNILEKAPKIEVPSRLGRKGAGYACMRPTVAPLHTFAPNAMTGPTPPPLEIYGVSRPSNIADDAMVLQMLCSLAAYVCVYMIFSRLHVQSRGIPTFSASPLTWMLVCAGSGDSRHVSKPGRYLVSRYVLGALWVSGTRHRCVKTERASSVIRHIFNKLIIHIVCVPSSRTYR